MYKRQDHEFDFRGCSDSSATADTGFNGTGITATAKNGANCSAEGMVFDGSDDYVDVTPWLFGGKPMTVEAYVKRDSASGNYDRILQFSDAVNAEAVVLSTDASSVDTVEFKVLNSGWKRGVSDANEYPTNTWVHIVGTGESDSTVKIYVDGGRSADDGLFWHTHSKAEGVPYVWSLKSRITQCRTVRRHHCVPPLLARRGAGRGPGR